MARKGGNSTQRMAPPPIHHGSANAHANALPPPSTIAAQILHNASNVHARHNAEAKVSFGELVKEFLQHPNTDEPDSQLVALISVISEAGLEGLFKDDPFAQDQQRQQGVDSIDALKIIIEQKPHLLMSTKDGDEQGGPRPPLLLWLFPKLLRLLTHTTLQFVHQPAQELLGLCLGALVQTSALWRQIRATLRLYKSCVQTILVELKFLDDTPSLRRQKFYIPLPSSSTISEFWTESQQFVALPHDLQAVLASPLAAIYVGLRLLIAIVSATGSENRKQAGPALFEHEVLWAMDSTIILWQSFNRRTTASDKQSLRNEIVMLYLQLIEALTVSAAGPEYYFSNSPKAAQALVKSLTNFIEQDSFSTVSESNQLQLASFFTRLRSSLLSLSSCTSVLQGRQAKNRPITLEVLETSIARFCQSTELFSAVHKDLQLALCLWTTPGTWPVKVADLRQDLCEKDSRSFAAAQIGDESQPVFRAFRTLNLVDDDRPAKRRKILPEGAEDRDLNTMAYEQLVATLSGSIQEAPALDLSNLHHIIPARFSSMSNDDQQNQSLQSDILEAFAGIACAGSGTFRHFSARSKTWKGLRCKLCDDSGDSKRDTTVYWDTSSNSEDWKKVIAAMLLVTKEAKFQASTKSRVLMALAIGRVFNHIGDSEYLSLEMCELGQWLLASMSRSLRELKLAATTSLMVFLRDDLSKKVKTKNRRLAIEFLDALSKRDALSDQETLIMAYGQIAHVCGELELPIVLHHLVEFLGHPNALVCGMAYCEIGSIAKKSSIDTTQLLSPYWKVIGFSVIKDIINKPQKAQQLADLTEQSVRQLLIQTQSETLPHLVLSKRKDIVEKIAQARKASVVEVLTQPRANLAKILALLLSQPVTDVERNAMDTLAAVEPAMRESSSNRLEAWVTLDVTGIAIEILMLAADQEGTRKKPFYDGFTMLTMLADTKSAQRKSSSKSKTLDAFCEAHILGIIAHFSDIIESPLAHGKATLRSLPERKRSIAAIGDLISLARYSVNGALPQIRACLQSAMADPDLCDDTFAVWMAFLKALDADETMLVIDQTFALIVQHWTLFSEETQNRANEAILNLTKHHNAQLRARIEYLPSLAGIPMLSKTEAELERFKEMVDIVKVFQAFSNRCKDQNAVVVRRALKELVPFLDTHQKILHQSMIDQKPLPVLAALTRSLLDASVRFVEDHTDITVLCAECLGIIGGVDPYRVETVREKKRVLMLSNFSKRDEDINFVAMLLEQVLVKVFLSTTNAKAQGWIAYVMQEMLKHCGFSGLHLSKPRSSQNTTEAQRWNEIPEAVRNVLTPFLNSKYSVNQNPALQYQGPTYPIFATAASHGLWLQTFVYDLLRKGQGVNVEMVFPVLARIIRGYDLSIATFIFPFAALNVIVSDDERNSTNVGIELLTVLQTKIQLLEQQNAPMIKQCSENVFQTLDYLSLWLQEKRKAVAEARVMAGKTGRGVSEDEEMNAIKQISRVEGILQLIPAEIISRRAVECGSYARALFNWEQYYRQQEHAKVQARKPFSERDELLQHLQMIYAHIDEPDSIEGISAHLKVLSPEQQVIEDRKAGRWTAAQSWYEIALAENPDDTETQINLLTCLKESGQYDSILNYVDGLHTSKAISSSTLPFAAEAAWSVGKWEQLERLLGVSSSANLPVFMDFNVGVGRALLALRHRKTTQFQTIIRSLRQSLAKSMSPSVTTSIQACHDHLVKLHALYEIEAISGTETRVVHDRDAIIQNLDLRLHIIGAYTSDKQYLLGLRRAAMTFSGIQFTESDIASAWLTTGRLARQGDFMTTAFNSVLHAERLGDNASKIEYSKLLWKEGHHRKAIQNLRGAIDGNAFQSDETVPVNVSVTTTDRGDDKLSKVKCHAQLLLAKWLDQAGQTQAGSLKEEYVLGVQIYPRWDKGHYYLGRWYLKLLESEKRSPVSRQSSEYLSGSLIKLVIENFVRSTVYGTKYYYQTLPKILTLWLDMGMEVMNTAPRTVKDKEFHDHRLQYLEHINKYLKRYSQERMPAFAWYSAFPQIITRISHPNKTVWEALQSIIIRVASAYPQQALWSLLAVLHSTQDDRRGRGTAVLQKLRDSSKKKGASLDLKNLIIQGQRLTDALLAACDAPVEQRVTHVSLSKDLGFSHKLAPTPLVVPIEANLLPSLPAGNDSQAIRRHNPFPADAITIHSFSDDVLVLSSLQRPRKLNVRGSDGKSYGLLCKPKDDLRKDQRLMEFNAMINRALQQDIGSSRRRLYIKTYAVTPLNEECGTIEWVEGLKPMRDIIIRFYRQHNISIDYSEIRLLLNEASSSPSKISVFTERILGKFIPVLHEWFVETFPEPEAWFAARLRYTRSCAVMSIVGHVLGLGDRHGENVLLEQGDGGTFHVDFNCLFDKGLTFEKPELVPFRLTHNMVDAMGPQGVEGPFRKAAELTYKLLRQHEDTLITILETFVHDPTADFLGGRKRKKIFGVPDTPQEVLDITRGKVNGYLKGESVPLSVEGYVEALIAMAKDPANLAAMYIGWCAFF